MGLSGISIGSLLLIFLIVLLVFGTKRLRNIGEDVGTAVRSFRKGLQQGELDDVPAQDAESKDQDP